jgi:hypothetical protein
MATMPQLLSRRDDAGWLTPAMADILMQHTAPLLPEDALRDQIAEIQQRLADLETPIRIVDIRPSPSHVLYIARPEVPRRGSRKPATPADIRRNLGKLSEEHEDWTLGFMGQVQDDADTVGILLRVPQHQPIRLRQVVLSNSFQHQPSTLAMALGVTLEQQIIVRDIANLGHLMVVGSLTGVRHLLGSALLSLIMLNTPGELRIALLGSSSKPYGQLIHTPHALGRLLDTPDTGQRLLDGMVKEVQRRHQWFAETQIDSLDAYNVALRNRGEAPLPRILILLSSLSDPEWQAASENWAPALYDLLVNGSKVGIYTVITAEQMADIPELLSNVVETWVVMRSAADQSITERVKHLHASALRFVDAFVINKRQTPDVIPIELCTISEQDMQNLITYWRQLATQRAREARPQERTGLTDILPELEGSGLGTSETPQRATGPLPTRTRAGILARATQALSGEADEKTVTQAMTLAAYLGWLGIGPLRDIFSLSGAEARTVITTLQNMGVIEDGEGPIYRFQRLIENPLLQDINE